MTDYKKEKLIDLRPLATGKRKKNVLWTGAELQDASKDDVVFFLETGLVPKLSYKVLGGGIIRLNRRSFTKDEFKSVFVELADRFREPDIITQQLNQINATLAELMKRTVPIPNSVSGKALVPVPANSPGTGNRIRVVAPDDITPLVETIRGKHLAGEPFRKSGKRGLYKRRDELPDPFNIMAKHPLEAFVDGAVKAGQVDPRWLS